MGSQSGRSPSSADGLSAKARSHFMSPSNVGSIQQPDAVARRENQVCGDAMVLYLKVEGETVQDIRFKTFGCSTSIAASSALTVAVKGRSLKHARALKHEDIEAELGGLSSFQRHSIDLVLETLEDALSQLAH